MQPTGAMSRAHASSPVGLEPQSGNRRSRSWGGLPQHPPEEKLNTAGGSACTMTRRDAERILVLLQATGRVVGDNMAQLMAVHFHYEREGEAPSE